MFIRISRLSVHTFPAIPRNCQLLYEETAAKGTTESLYLQYVFGLVSSTGLAGQQPAYSKCPLQHKETGGVNLPFLATDTH
jgi:hypothetical protein